MDAQNNYSLSTHAISAQNAALPLTLKITALILFGVGLIWGFHQPLRSYETFTICGGVLMTLIALLKLMACFSTDKRPVHMIHTQDLPIVSIFLPLYQEAPMVSILVENILKLNYPLDKLDIVILCEPEDMSTIRAAKSLAVPPVRLFITNGLLPRTKPNALNQGLLAAKGVIITVYDAEDRPHPDQLITGVCYLLSHEDVAVVQAPLTYYNFNTNWTTRQFTLEYDGLFRVWLPFLNRLDLPFPLGGTSNHIRRSALHHVGGWDAYNVTEDADLGFRLAAHNWKHGYISIPTDEECVANFKDWNHQRKRWLKGYIQTLITHLNHPLRPKGISGLKRQITLHLTITACLIAAYIHVPVLVLTCMYSAGLFLTGQNWVPPLFFIFCLILSYTASICVTAVGAKRAGHNSLIKHSLWQPFYWLWLFIPAIGAWLEFYSRPFHWNKTSHGHSIQK